MARNVWNGEGDRSKGEVGKSALAAGTTGNFV